MTGMRLLKVHPRFSQKNSIDFKLLIFRIYDLSCSIFTRKGIILPPIVQMVYSQSTRAYILGGLMFPFAYEFARWQAYSFSLSKEGWLMVSAKRSSIFAALQRYFPPSNTLPAAKLLVMPEISKEVSRISSLIQERSIFENYIDDLLVIYLSTQNRLTFFSNSEACTNLLALIRLKETSKSTSAASSSLLDCLKDWEMLSKVTN